MFDICCVGWLYPVDELEKMIEKKNNNILADFPSFYNMLYYQYARSINIYLADVVKDFLPMPMRIWLQTGGFS